MQKRPLKGSVILKRAPIFWETALSVEQISQALKVTPSDVISKFRDGRVYVMFANLG